MGEETMTASLVGLRAIAFAIAFAAAPAFAQMPQSSAAEARIVVTGEGSVSVVPDYAAISAGVVSRAKTAGEAADANAKSMAAVISALTDAGIARNDVQTVQYSLQPVYTSPVSGGLVSITLICLWKMSWGPFVKLFACKRSEGSEPTIDLSFSRIIRPNRTGKRSWWRLAHLACCPD